MAAAPAARWAPTSLAFILLILASYRPSDRTASAKLVVGSLKTGENWAFVSRFCFLSLHGRFQALGSNEPSLVKYPLCCGIKTALKASRTSFRPMRDYLISTRWNTRSTLGYKTSTSTTTHRNNGNECTARMATLRHVPRRRLYCR